MLTMDRSGWSGDGTRVLGAHVRWTTVPTDLPGGRALPRATFGRMVASDDAVLYDGPDVRVLVRGTEEILIEPRGPRTRADVAHYVYGFGARVVLLHAGRFSIHGTAVRTPVGVVVLAGDSGAGKSTTAVALTEGGGQVLVDDVAPLRPEGSGVLVEPFARPIHLLEDALHRVRPDRLARVDRAYVAGPEGKAVYRLPADADDTAPAVACLVVLDTVPGTGPLPVATEVRGAQRLQWIVRLSNVVGVSSFGARREAYFRWAAEVAGSVPLWHVARDPQADCLRAVVRVVRGLLDASAAAATSYGGAGASRFGDGRRDGSGT